MSLRLAPLTMLAFFACAKTEPAVQVAALADSSASARASASVATGVAPPIDAAVAAGPNPDAGAGGGPARANLEPPCAGAAIDLTAVLLDGRCQDGTEGPAVGAAALGVSVAAPSRLAPGAEGVATITWTNTTGAPLDLYVAVPPAFSDGLAAGLGLGGAGERDGGATAKEARTIPVGQFTTSADGKRMFNATWAMLMARPRTAHVRLDAAGTLLFRTTLRARGFLPSKTYDPGRFSVDNPPDPLPVGRYRVAFHDPIRRKASESPTVDLAVGK